MGGGGRQGGIHVNGVAETANDGGKQVKASDANVHSATRIVMKASGTSLNDCMYSTVEGIRLICV